MTKKKRSFDIGFSRFSRRTRTFSTHAHRTTDFDSLGEKIGRCDR